MSCAKHGGLCKYWLLTIPVVRKIGSCSLLLVKKMPISNRHQCNRHFKICLRDLPNKLSEVLKSLESASLLFFSPHFAFPVVRLAHASVESKLGSCTPPVSHFHRHPLSSSIHITILFFVHSGTSCWNRLYPPKQEKWGLQVEIFCQYHYCFCSAGFRTWEGTWAIIQYRSFSFCILNFQMLYSSFRSGGRLKTLLYIKLEQQIKFWAIQYTTTYINLGCAIIPGYIPEQTMLGLRWGIRTECMRGSKGGRLMCNGPTSLLVL